MTILDVTCKHPDCQHPMVDHAAPYHEGPCAIDGCECVALAEHDEDVDWSAHL